MIAITKDTTFFILGGLWMLSALFDYAFFTYYAQLKEYRYDRFRDFLTTEHGRAFLFDFRMIWRAIIIAVLYPLLSGTLSGIVLLVGILFMDLTTKCYHVAYRQVRRPRPTAKSLLIMITAMFVESVIFFVVALPNIILLFMVFRFVIIGAVVSLVNVPSTFTKLLIMRRAERKLRRYANLKVVGITGSYGKSTTKEFLSHMLEGAYKVIKTPKNINTGIGIATFILKTDFDGADIFVVEMGAYRVGEIQAICDMVHPKVGILTAVSPQHLSLFGSMENICQAKHELLRALPKHGVAITNADNLYCRRHVDELHATTVQTFGTDPEYTPTLLIEGIRLREDGIQMTTVQGEERRIVDIPVMGKHNAYNVSAAALAAHSLGVADDTIDRQIESLPNGQGQLQKHTYGLAIILHDSANANPDGFKAALDVLNTYPSDKKRVVITSGIPELGEHSQETHAQIGGEVSFVADELVITSPDFAESIASGVVSKFNTHVRRIYKPKNLIRYMRSLQQDSVVILFEGKTTPEIRSAFDFLT